MVRLSLICPDQSTHQAAAVTGVNTFQVIGLELPHVRPIRKAELKTYQNMIGTEKSRASCIHTN